MVKKKVSAETALQPASQEQIDRLVDEPGSWTKSCKKCKQRFIAMRSNAIFCSGSCKVLFSMHRSALLQIAHEMPEKTLKECKLKLRAYDVALS